MSKVTSIRGYAIPEPGQPQPEVVQELEMLLDRAKSGEVIGILWSTSHPDGTSSNHFIGRISRSMVGSAFAVMSRVSRELDG